MKKLGLVLAALGLLSCLFLPMLASADVNNFTITDFSADEILSRADPQGELHIVEHIGVNFTDYKHGILRAIPDSYKHHSLQMKVNNISSDGGAATSYTTSHSNGNTILRIGDPNRTVTGPQKYTLDYTVRNVISFYNDHDELYWDVNGDQWQQPFNHVAVTLHLPSDVKLSQNPLCYSGSFGSQNQACAVTATADGFSVATTAGLSANQTLTYVAAFPKGSFQPFKWYDRLTEELKPILEVLIPFIVLGGGSFAYWLAKGRDPKGTGIIVPQYDSGGLKPIEAGAIIDFKVDNRDITATIIDLAIRGYIKIIETKESRTLRKATLTYNLQLQNADFSALDPHETALMIALFNHANVGNAIDMAALKNQLYSAAKELGSTVESELTAQGYFKNNPATTGKGIVVGVIGAFILVFYGGKFLGLPLVIGLVLGGIIAIICSFAMGSRTAKGVAAKEHIEGLKLYLNVAEKDRIAMLQSPNAPYAANATEPVKTVDLFEKLLPYAMVLGVEKQWSKQFESIYTEPPTWYSGNLTAFNAYYLASSLTDGMGAAVDTAFSAPSSSGGSGIGGGGFSGGGGGGGGGGGW